MAQSSEDHIPELIKDFFASKGRLHKSLEACALFICRHDGVLVHSKSFELPYDPQALGALMGGLWQAAKALTECLPQQPTDFFRMSFDTSSKGLYALPIQLASQEYYLGALFFEEVNPGMVKSIIRKLSIDLENYLKENLSGPKNRSTKESTDSLNASDSDNNKNFLFNDISDDEMDHLFSFAGQ